MSGSPVYGAVTYCLVVKGIEEKYELPAPMQKNLHHLTDSERKELGIESLPVL